MRSRSESSRRRAGAPDARGGVGIPQFCSARRDFASPLPGSPPLYAACTDTVALRSSFPHPTTRPRKAEAKALSTTQYITCR